MKMLKEIFPKGKTVKAKGIQWYGVVVEAPRKKVDDGFATMMVEVFGFEHETGSVYCKEYEPVSVEEFKLFVNEPLYFKGELK